MDSLAPNTPNASVWSSHLPKWTRPRTHDFTESDAAFVAGVALKSLDDLIRANPPWLGCWRDRLALKSAAVAARMLGRGEEEAAIRDAVLLMSAGDDPGPTGKVFLATRMLAHRNGTITTPFVREVARLLGMKWDHSLASILEIVDSADQSGRAAPFAVADLITAISAVRPDAEVMALGLADVVLAQKLNWPKPVPLLLPERFGPAFRTIGGRGRVRPGEPAYPKAICLALVDGVEAALRSAVEIDRRAARLLAVAPNVRTKGAEPVIRRLLTEDAVPASAPGSKLSRWAANRLFERLESFEAVRELSGRSAFRIFWIVIMAGSPALKPSRRRANAADELLYDRELDQFPAEMRWREWMMRVEAVIFASAEPVSRETLARVVGKDCSIDLLIDDLIEELRDRPYELVSVAGGWQHRTRPRFAETIRASSAPTRGGAAALSEFEAMVLMAVGYFQPVTRSELSKIFGKEVSRDVIGNLRSASFIGSGPRSPTPGAPYTYVTTPHFLSAFGMETLRDLPNIEALEDAGLLSRHAVQNEIAASEGGDNETDEELPY